MEPPWDGRTKVCSNGPGHMTKMPECQTMEGTALDILKEETLSMFPIYDTCINGQESVCCMCRSILHSQCMSESNEEVCLVCASDKMQILESKMPDRRNTLHSLGHCGNILDNKKVENSVQPGQKVHETVT